MVPLWVICVSAPIRNLRGVTKRTAAKATSPTTTNDAASLRSLRRVLPRTVESEAEDPFEEGEGWLANGGCGCGGGGGSGSRLASSTSSSVPAPPLRIHASISLR